MILKPFLMTIIILTIAFYWLPGWLLGVIVGLVFLFWLYTISPRYSFGGYSFLAPTKNKILALTFTGGNSENLNQVLQWLNNKNISAVFFVYGKVAQENPIIIQDMIRAGQLIGITGFESKEDWFMKHFDSDDIHKTIHRSQEALAQAIPNFHTTLFRPQRGRKMIFNPWRLKHNFGYYVVLWSFLLGRDDLKKIKSRMIINVDLDHPQTEGLLSGLQTLKDYTQLHGYQFVQIEI